MKEIEFIWRRKFVSHFRKSILNSYSSTSFDSMGEDKSDSRLLTGTLIHYCFWEVNQVFRDFGGRLFSISSLEHGYYLTNLYLFSF
jgi:hypothetical protein